jgi:plastocyanin
VSARRKTFLAFLVAPLMVALSLVGVSVANAARSDSATHAHQNIAVPTITISSFIYHTPASVKKGALIKVINKDSAPHTVTSDVKGKFNVSVPAHSSRTFHAPATAGSFKFHCTVHPTMHGLLKVVS